MRSLILVAFCVSAFSAEARVPIWYHPEVPAFLSSTGPTPLFEMKQIYLDAAPAGVGARDAWSLPGGTGSNVKIVDIEVCWQTDHEDFEAPFYVGNNPLKQCEEPHHGTAVWGVMAAKKDEKGVTGIAYGSKVGVYGFLEGEEDQMSDRYIAGIRAAIRGALTQLQPGDVLVIEQEMNGPDGDTAVEYWPEIFAELKAATDRGVICVEAAGNGSSNLDGDAYKGAFDLNKRDSGCIVVGAGGRDWRRLFFSNYGARVDAFGYGDQVTTTGYGELFNASPTRVYTGVFNGTSSATPIVAGAIAVVSSIAKSNGRVLTPLEIRGALRSTGTHQNGSDQRIGNLPNIGAMVKMLFPELYQQEMAEIN